MSVLVSELTEQHQHQTLTTVFINLCVVSDNRVKAATYFLILWFSGFLRCCGWVPLFRINFLPLSSGLRYEYSYGLTDATTASLSSRQHRF